MIDTISTEVISSTYDGGRLWFHPRACAVPHAGGTKLVMTGQSISGSDVFGHVHWMTSADGGRSWSDPEPIPELGRRLRDDGIEIRMTPDLESGRVLVRIRCVKRGACPRGE